MPVIYSSINEFDRTSEVYLRTEENNIISLGTVDNSNLSEALYALCNEQSIYHVHLFGSDDFLIGIAAKMRHENELTYKHQDINIEVN